MTYEAIERAATEAGLVLRGAFHPLPDEQTALERSGSASGTILLFGFTGRIGWGAFAASPEKADEKPHPLDRWSERVIGALAERFGAVALFPFGGPPWHPFQQWAQRASSVHPSPLGLLIDPDFGLWHSYRGAIAMAERLDLPARIDRPSPCESCRAKPCLSACPVNAFSAAGYSVDACARHISAPAGADCMTGGCLACRACPIGADHHPIPAQATFHMTAFLAARL